MSWIILKKIFWSIPISLPPPWILNGSPLTVLSRFHGDVLVLNQPLCWVALIAKRVYIAWFPLIWYERLIMFRRLGHPASRASYTKQTYYHFRGDKKRIQYTTVLSYFVHCWLLRRPVNTGDVSMFSMFGQCRRRWPLRQNWVSSRVDTPMQSQNLS